MIVEKFVITTQIYILNAVHHLIANNSSNTLEIFSLYLILANQLPSSYTPDSPNLTPALPVTCYTYRTCHLLPWSGLMLELDHLPLNAYSPNKYNLKNISTSIESYI